MRDHSQHIQLSREDAVAATLILEGYLTFRRRGG